jgi:hypothetical protein
MRTARFYKIDSKGNQQKNQAHGEHLVINKKILPTGCAPKKQLVVKELEKIILQNK